MHILALAVAILLALPPRSPSAYPADPDQPRAPDGVQTYSYFQWAVEDPSAPAAQQYVVQAGDTLFLIAMRFGVGMDVISRANGLRDADLIAPGMTIEIPWSNVAGTARYAIRDPVVEGAGLHFVVSISRRVCWLFNDRAMAWRLPCSPGRDSSPSIPGNYTIQSKAPRAYSLPAEFWMPYWLGVYDAGAFENGIHGFPYSADTGERVWEDQVGVSITYGCVMLDDPVMRVLYDIAYVGMPVTILP